MGIHDGHREQLRARFRTAGLDAFADHEALELLLFYAIPRRDTNETAHRLLERYGSLAAVLDAPAEDLQQVPGIGARAAGLIALVAPLVRKSRLGDGKERVLTSARAAGEYAAELLAPEREETLLALCLDGKGRLLACRRLGEGSLTGAGLDLRRLTEAALTSRASAVILAHNHPSGIALPSREDCRATARARDVLAAVGVALLDHIVTSDGDFVSLAESGLLEPAPIEEANRRDRHAEL